MGLLRIIIGAIVGSIISFGCAIGLIYGGVQVSWWLALVLGILGLIIGGFAAGFIARDRFPGMIAGFLTGILVFIGIFLFFWLVLKAQVLQWYNEYGFDASIRYMLDYIGIDPTSALGVYITTKINETTAGNVDLYVQKYVPRFTAVIAAIFGGSALLVNTISGRIGGRFNKIDEIMGE